MTQTNKPSYGNPSPKQAPSEKQVPDDKTKANPRSPSESEERHRQGGHRVPDQNDRKRAPDRHSP